MDCPICYESKPELDLLTQCGHSFHKQCLHDYSKFQTDNANNTSCPLCRALLIVYIPPEPRNPRVECTYDEHGKLHGNYKRWYSNGQLYVDSNYEHDKYHGNRKVWYRNGQLMIDETYELDNLHGNRKWWHENGQLYEDENYEHGKRHGNRKEWHQNGKLTNDVEYKDGKEIRDNLKVLQLFSGDSLEELIKYYQKSHA